MTTKRCSHCHATLTAAHFGKSVSARDGLQNQCRTCRIDTCRRAYEKKVGRPVRPPSPPRVNRCCKLCAMNFSVPWYRSTTAKFCSKKCAHIGRNQSSWNKGHTKRTHPMVAKLSSLAKQRWANGHYFGTRNPFYGKTHSEQTKATLRAQRLGKPRPDISVLLKDYYAAHPEKHPNHVLAKKGHETQIERLLGSAMLRHNMIFERQRRVGRYWIDFAFPIQNLGVEADGRYWHDPINDAVRDEALARHGWQILHFTDTEILDNVEKCVETVMACLLHLATSSTGTF